MAILLGPPEIYNSTAVTVTSGDPTVTFYDPTVPSGYPTVTYDTTVPSGGNPTITFSDPTDTFYDPTVPSGYPIVTSGDPTVTSGDPSVTFYDPTVPSGYPTATQDTTVPSGGNPTITFADPTDTFYGFTVPSVYPMVTSGDPTVPSGYPTVPSGYPIVTFGYPIVTFGDPTLTVGYPFVITGDPFVFISGYPFVTYSGRFMDQMVADSNNIQSLRGQNMGFTPNSSPTFLSTGDHCLDFFFHIVPGTAPSSLTQRLQLAWSHNPLTTLKLVCNLRGVRGTGKSDKEGFYAAALWLYTNHPRTLAFNVPSFAEFGCFNDLPEILYRISEGLDVRKLQKEEWRQRKGSRKYNKISRSRKEKKTLFTKAKIPKMNQKEIARAARQEKRIPMAKKVVQRYQDDANFRLVYDHISDHFAECLEGDVEFLKSGELRKVTLAAKWCPSIDSSFDQSTLLCESIARRIFPRESYPEYQGVEEAHYAYRIRNRLRKEILVPLRKVLELPEVYIGANQWGSIPYNRVESVAMKFYKEKFLKHDKERFSKYLEDVKSGKSTIAAGALLPHEIVASLNDGDDGQVAELQWKSMVDDLLKKGKLRSSLAICDVSASMYGIPMEVSVAMGILVSETSEEPWKGKVITFSQNPNLHLIEGENLVSKVEFVRRIDWGMNTDVPKDWGMDTDFQKVFDLILEVAVNGNLKEEQMIKRVFVFSGMEFDQASCNAWETDYEAVKRKFREKGYGSAVPQIVFWNLRDSRATPVLSNQDGVALVSGFSKNLLQLFLDNDGTINPQAVMEAAISGQEYEKLLVLD